MRLILPLIWFFVALWAGSAIGDIMSKKTGKKTIGWPVGIVVFIVLFTLLSAMTNRVSAAPGDEPVGSAHTTRRTPIGP